MRLVGELHLMELFNSNVRLRLDEPGRLYKGTRFDHAGYLYSIALNGSEFCTTEHRDGPMGAGGAGLCSEFGIFHPPGFDEANPGDWFLKPGVGLLKKKSERYAFDEAYECLSDDVEVKQDKQSIQFVVQGRAANGYQLRIARTVTLTEQGVMIHYDLANTGAKEIHTEEYIHNFISIGGYQIGPGYSLKLDAIWDHAHLPECIKADGDRLICHDCPNEPFYFQARPDRNVTGAFGATIQFDNVGCFQEVDQFTPTIVAVWGCPHALSVESFKQIDLRPGERLSYEREIKLSLYEKNE